MTLSRLCIHTITTKPWSLPEAAKAYADRGIAGISVWEDAIQPYGAKEARKIIEDHGLETVSLVRGGFFPHTDAGERQRAIEHNRGLIECAELLGAPMVVLVCGAHPQQPLHTSRQQIVDGIQALLPDCEAHQVKLAIEPLHPMYADTRSAINTMRQANEAAEAIQSPWVGIAVDVYHLWWDPELEAEIERCGSNGHLFAFHICDWKSPTEDMLNDRGIMGEGCIPIAQIRQWVMEAGFDGYEEVEIFSTKYWAQDQSAFLDDIVQAYHNLIEQD